MRRPDLAATRRALSGAAWYPVLLAGATIVLRSRPPGVQDVWFRFVSTDLRNLADHPVRCLTLSAFLAQHDLAPWVVLALAGLAVVVRRIGAVRAGVLVLAVHVAATLASQGLVAWRVRTGALPGSARVMLDLGPSYVVVAALVAAAALGRGWERLLGAGGYGLLAPYLFVGLPDLDVAAVGHVLSTVLALAGAVVVLLWRRRTAMTRGRPGGAGTAGEQAWPTADSNRGPG